MLLKVPSADTNNPEPLDSGLATASDLPSTLALLAAAAEQSPRSADQPDFDPWWPPTQAYFRPTHVLYQGEYQEGSQVLPKHPQQPLQKKHFTTSTEEPPKPPKREKRADDAWHGVQMVI